MITNIIAILLFLIVFIPTVMMLIFVITSLRDNLKNLRFIFILILVTAFSVLVFFRPHRHTFQALDSSGYRLMAKSFKDGRPMIGVDMSYCLVKKNARKSFLLNPNELGRITRDRSFEILNIDTCKYAPFFYPILPLTSLGMDLLLPGDQLDYFVPLMASIFFISFFMFACKGIGIRGGIIAIILMLSTAFPVWLFRGFYAESVSAILIGMALVTSKMSNDRLAKYLSAYALGLAVMFHPVMLLPSLAILYLMLFFDDDKLSRFMVYLGMFSIGIAILLLFNIYICHPYGVVSIENIKTQLANNSSIRPAFLITIITCLICSTVLIFKDKIKQLQRRKIFRLVEIILVIIMFAPTLLSILFWEKGQGHSVLNGLIDLYSGMGMLLSFLFIIALVIIILFGELYYKILVAVLGFILPLFLYLKGVEFMGLWSQRRLIVPVIIALVSILGGLATILQKKFKYKAKTINILIGLFAICLFVNFLRSPDVYIASYDKGASLFVEKVNKELKGDITLFDYFPDSIPFAVNGKYRIYGLSEYKGINMNAVGDWIKSTSLKTNVYIVSSYSHKDIKLDGYPLEDGVYLEKQSVITSNIFDVRSKRAFPAKGYINKKILTIYKVSPINNDIKASYKVFDGSPIGIRGEWEKGRLNNLSAEWSKDRSGIIGLIPDRGKSIKITFFASASRKDRPFQKLIIIPPWTKKGYEVTIGNRPDKYSIEIYRDKDDKYKNNTGVYRLYPVYPYNPAIDGIKGYSKALGALIHWVEFRKQ